MNIQRRAELYLREYPRLLRQINQLVELVGNEEPNVVLLALFGSTARLTPHVFSDADLLILLHDLRPLEQVGEIAHIMHLLYIAQDAPKDEWCWDWFLNL